MSEVEGNLTQYALKMSWRCAESRIPAYFRGDPHIS
jgi:hypothetical protein